MSRKISFTKDSKIFMNEFRDKINNVERTTEVNMELSVSMRRLFKKIFDDEQMKIPEKPIRLSPKVEDESFVLDITLKNNKTFMEVWNSSDLPAIVAQFARAASHRYIHLAKHTEKTNKKIRNGT